MSRPLLQLLLAPGGSSRIRHMLEPLAERCEVRALDQSLPPGPVLAGSWDTPGVQSLLDGGRPTAVWIADTGELHTAGGAVARFAAVVTADPAVAGAAAELGAAAVLAGRPVLDVRRIRTVMPAVRARWRERHRLPADLVVDLRRLPAASLPTASALAAAVVAGEAQVEEALAHGAPTVTSARAAAALGAIDGDHLVIDEHDPVAAAMKLAADVDMASALSRAGRRLVEQRHDVRGAVSRLLELLELRSTDAEARLRHHLDLLWTPAGSGIAGRSLVAVAALAEGRPA